MTEMPTTEEAHEQGRSAFHAGVHYNTAPYGWWLNIAWRSGWASAQREANRKDHPHLEAHR